MGISLHMGTNGEPRWVEGLIYQELRGMDGGGLWKQVPLSLWELCEENLEGRLLYWGP